jgi:molybdenum cofactor sulfurtransferase
VQTDTLLLLLDCAKAAQTRPPDLSSTPVHFAVCSYYKLFGCPTGLGALLVRSDCLHLLTPRFAGGGTIKRSLPVSWPALTTMQEGAAAFEPGTMHFQGIAALGSGFAAWQAWAQQPRGRRGISRLASELSQALQQLRHAGNRPMVTVYRDAHALGIACSADEPEWGPTVAFNCWSASGEPIGCHHVCQLLRDAGIVVRAGGCCNPGACAAVLGFSDSDLQHQHAHGVRCGGQEVSVVDGRHVGVVRASLGARSRSEDVASLLTAVESICKAAVCTARHAAMQSDSAGDGEGWASTSVPVMMHDRERICAHGSIPGEHSAS